MIYSGILVLMWICPQTVYKLDPCRGNQTTSITVNVEISAQYIFSGISCKALDAQKLYDVHEHLNYYRSKRINLLYARKFAHAKMLDRALWTKI